MKEKINLMIADNHPLMVDGIIAALKDETNINIVGSAINGQQLLNEIPTLNPEIVLLDIKMPILDGLETAKQLKTLYPHIKCIIISSFNNSGFVRKAIQCGCAGYLLKDCEKPELVKAIKTVYDGGLYFNPKNGRGLVHDMEPATLSGRELEILKLIATENCSRTIAQKLNITPNTVKTHRERLMIKAGVKNTPGLVYWAMKNNHID